jgi:hypothetical protein
MIYIQTNENNRVSYTHNFPFDEEMGLRKTKAELESEGYLVESVPELEVIDNSKITHLCYTPQSGFYFEYTDRPLSQEEKLTQLEENFKSAADKYKEIDKSSTTLMSLQAAKIAVLKEACTAAIYDGFHSKSTGFSFGFNEHDQANFTQQLLMLVAGDTTPIQWKTKEAGVVELTTDQFNVIVGEAKDAKMVQQKKYWDLETAVLAATTKEEVDAINW